MVFSAAWHPSINQIAPSAFLRFRQKQKRPIRTTRKPTEIKSILFQPPAMITKAALLKNDHLQSITKRKEILYSVTRRSVTIN